MGLDLALCRLVRLPLMTSSSPPPGELRTLKAIHFHRGTKPSGSTGRDLRNLGLAITVVVHDPNLPPVVESYLLSIGRDQRGAEAKYSR